MGKGISHGIYRLACAVAGLICPKPTYLGAENIPEEPCVLVGNHAHAHGPVLAELYMPWDRAIWCNGEMMHTKEVPDYTYRDFWSAKPRSVRWLFRILSYLIAYPCACVFSNAHCIEVYRDARLTRTFRESLKRLEEGARVVIFPECYTPHNNIVYLFQEHFIALGTMYQRRTGKPLAFVPMYTSPTLHTVSFGEPVYYDEHGDAQAERERVCRELMERVTRLAAAQPLHRVVPYPNMPRRDYPMSLPVEERQA